MNNKYNNNNNNNNNNFLAVMSSSRSDVVTKCVLLSVCVSVHVSFFFLLVSFKILLVLKSFNGVSRQFKGCLKLKEV